MPTYVYKREDGTTFEVVQKITDEPLTVDPESGQAVQRVISGGAGLQFKGSGFYLTDYARSDGSKTSTSPASTSPSPGTTTPTPSEAPSSASSED